MTVSVLPEGYDPVRGSRKFCPVKIPTFCSLMPVRPLLKHLEASNATREHPEASCAIHLLFRGSECNFFEKFEAWNTNLQHSEAMIANFLIVLMLPTPF